MRKLIITGMAVAMLAIPTVASADKPVSIPSAHDNAVHNSNANDNACWGQDRSFYASEQFFGGDMDIKQSFDRLWAASVSSAPRGSRSSALVVPAAPRNERGWLRLARYFLRKQKACLTARAYAAAGRSY
jgi:hypothetical protein